MHALDKEINNVAPSVTHTFKNDIPKNKKLSASKRSGFYGSMPNLMSDPNSRIQQSKYDTPREFFLLGNRYYRNANNEEEQGDKVRLQSGDTEFHIRQDRKSNGERLLKTHVQQESSPYDPITAIGEEDPSDDLRWRLREESEKQGFTQDINNSHYFKRSSEMVDRTIFENVNRESFTSDTERTPLTFSQANEALNQMQLNNSDQNSVHRSQSGAKSAESVYDMEDMLNEDNEFNPTYEQAYEAKILEQERLLDLMLMEKMNCEGRIEMALHYKRELENQLQLFRQYRRYGKERFPHQQLYIPRGFNQLNHASMNPCDSPYSPHLSAQISSNTPNTNYVNWPHTNRVFPMGYDKYANGSVDSIEELTRNSRWAPNEKDRHNNGQFPHMTNHYFRHSPYEAQHMGMQYDRLSFVPLMKDEHTELAGESRAIPYVRYSMYDLSSTGSPFLSAVTRNEANVTMRSPQSKSPHHNRSMNNVYVDLNKRIPPTHVTTTTSILSQPFELPHETYPSNAHLSQNSAAPTSPPIDQRMYNFSRIPRAEVRRRLQGIQRARPYSQERFTNEMLEENVRRRQDVAQLQQRRGAQAKKFLSQQELENLNLFPGCEYPMEQNISSTDFDHYHKPIDHFKDSSQHSQHGFSPKIIRSRFPRSDSPEEPIDPELAEICSRENISVSPSNFRAKPMNGTRKSSAFEPLPEISDEEFDSVRSATPTQANKLSVAAEVATETPPTRMKASPTVDMAEPVRVTLDNLDLSLQAASDITAKPTSEIPPQEQTQRSQVRILRVRSTNPSNGKTQTEDSSPSSLVKDVDSITIEDSYKSFAEGKSQNLIRTPGNTAMDVDKQAPAEANNTISFTEKPALLHCNSHEIIFVKESVRLLCLGPVDGRNMESHYNFQRSGNYSKDRYSTLPPRWIAVCHGVANVSVYDLQSRACIMHCEEHTRYSQRPVVALLPFVSQTATSIQLNMSDSDNDEVSRLPSGLLCIVQEDGLLTLYNVANRRVCGKISSKHDIQFATLLPHPRVIQNFLTQYILAITWFGAVICFQWNLTGYSREKDQERHPHWEGEIHDLGINIFDRLSENGRTVPYFSCICPQLAITPSPGAGSRSPRSPPDASKELPIGHFNLIAASQLKSTDSTTRTVRICRWVLKSSQLKLALCIDKNLTCEPESKLVGITYAEIGGAASVCLCMTADIFWFSLKSSDLVSSFRLPTCTQPAVMLPSIWPYKFLSSSLRTKPNERLWTVVSSGRLLEVSAVESQRRRDASGFGCMMLLNVYPSDVTITAVTSTMYEQEVVIAGTEKGEIHIIPVPTESYTCKVPNCMLGFCSRESLIHHVVRDHFLADCPTTPNATIHCMWPNCDYPIKDSSGKINLTRLEAHAAQHLSDQ